jgi:hypothetical protein
MTLVSGDRKAMFGSDSGSGEEDSLIQNKHKIISYGAQEHSALGVRMCSLL